jgi:ammonia channel protein AmtB
MKLKPIKQKKGDIFQILIVLIIIFALALIGFLTLTITTRVNTFWDDSGLLNETAVGTEAINKMQDTAPKTTDYAILFLFIGMNIGIIISAVRTNFSPVTIILFIFLTFISIMIAAGMVNMYQGLAQSPSVSDIGESLTFTNFLFSKYLPLIICVVSALVMLLMWGKSGGDIIS